MERAVILLDAPTLDVPDLERLTGPSAAAPVGAAATPADLFKNCKTFSEFQDLAEKLFLQQRLTENEWNVKRTAESLGMQRSHLYKKIERYGLK
jgi:two-component system, NtrC family, nitrogen regulation response regulator NtrX